MTSELPNDQPAPLRINEADAQQPPAVHPVAGEIDPLLGHLVEACSSLKSTSFRITLRDRQTGEDIFIEQDNFGKLLSYLPTCLSRLWRWNEILLIESCDPAQDEDSGLEEVLPRSLPTRESSVEALAVNPSKRKGE
jgi:hypothetical protein